MAGARMKYPYTLGAKVAMFPWKTFINNHFYFKYYLASVVLCFPLFYKIQTMVNSPAAVKAHAEKLAKEAAEHH